MAWVKCPNTIPFKGPDGENLDGVCLHLNPPEDEFCGRCEQRVWTDCTKCGEANVGDASVCSLCGELTEYGAEVQAEEKRKADEEQQRKEETQRQFDELAARREEARRNNPAIAAKMEAEKVAYEKDQQEVEKRRKQIASEKRTEKFFTIFWLVFIVGGFFSYCF